MAIDFPNSPTTGQIFQGPHGTFIWDGAKWAPVTSGAPTIPYSSLPAEVQQLPIAFPYSDKPNAGQIICIPMAVALTKAYAIIMA